MKNQYFGDINDYRKYGLLRVLASDRNIKTAVCWMLTANDGGSDGRFTEYLLHPDRWREFEPKLFDFLREIIIDREKRDVSALEESAFIKRASYYSTELTDHNRNDYFLQFRKKVTPSHLIFFDPDNGFEVGSVRKGGRGSRKYFYWDEASIFFSTGASLLVYQHFPRIERKKFLTLISKQIFSTMNSSLVVAFETTRVAFFLIPQKHHLRSLRASIEKVTETWGDEFSIQEFHRT